MPVVGQRACGFQCTYKQGTLGGEHEWAPRLSSIGTKRISATWGRHSVLPEEAEQVILNDPVDLGMEIVEGEERYLNLGATVQGRVLLVVTSWREDRVRVVTAFEPIKRLIQFYYQERER
jgi:uncharacterized DUF497 family protein